MTGLERRAGVARIGVMRNSDRNATLRICRNALLRMCDIALSVKCGGAHAPPLPNFQTGIPSFLALSARLSWMPVPGKTMTPIGSTSSICVVALERRGLGVLRPVGLEGDLRNLSVVGPLGGDQFGALGRSAMQQHHVGMLGVDLVELVPDQAMIVEVEPAGEGDLRVPQATAPRFRPGVWRRGNRGCRSWPRSACGG